jgi:hypothetical protein
MKGLPQNRNFSRNGRLKTDHDAGVDVLLAENLAATVAEFSAGRFRPPRMRSF